MAFDTDAARKSGYSDAEIADYLSQEKGFDASGARSSGYDDTEIIDYLSTPSGTQPKGASASVSLEGGQGSQSAPRQGIENVVVNENVDSDFDPRWMGADNEAALANMFKDPKWSFSQINDWVKSKAVEKGLPPLGLSGGGDEALKTYRDQIAKGAQSTGIGYQDWTADLAPAKPDGPQDDSLFSQLTRSYDDAVQYGTPGWLARKYHDLADTGMDDLRKRYPGATPEQLEELQTQLVEHGQKSKREANAEATKDDSFAPWIAGQVLGSPGVEDFVPGVAIEGVGAKAFAKRAGAAAVSNQVADAGYQGVDILDNVQDDFNFEQNALAPVIGAAFHGAIEGSGALASTAKNRIRPSAPSDVDVEAPVSGIVAPTTKNRKMYKDQLNNAANGMVSHINDIAGGWANAPEFEVHDNFKKLDGIDNDAIGVKTGDGKVLINAENVLAEAKAQDVSPENILSAVTYHEALGHYGLSQKFGEDLDTVLGEFLDSGSDTFRNRVQEWMNKHPDAYANESDPSIRAAEEVFAEWSEQGRVPVKMRDRFYNLIKDYARKMGIDLKYSTRELKAILGMAHNAVISGKGVDVAGNGYRYAKTYHGSGADFDEFDHSKMGSGEGAQAFGWGTYLADSKAVGEGYQKRIGGEVPTWSGVEGDWHSIRNNVLIDVNSRFHDSDGLLNPDTIAAEALTLAGDKGRLPTPGELSYHLDIDNNSTLVHDILEYMDKHFGLKRKGKLYEVEIPDDAKWLDWDNEVTGDIEQVFKELGIDKPKGFSDDDADLLHSLEEEWYQLSDDIKHGKVEVTEETKNRFIDLVDQIEELTRRRDNLSGDTGEGMYRALQTKLGSAEKASKALDEKGIHGTKFLDNFSRAKGEGTYNYVVYNDKTPKITNKYMKRLSKQDEDDLFETENAVHILNEITKDYVPTVMTKDEIQEAAERWGLSPSALLRRKSINPGDLSRRFAMNEIAATKMNDRLTTLYAKMQTGGFDEKTRADYMHTLFRMQELTARIFDEQGELGRALGSLRSYDYTRKKITGLQEVLGQFDTKNGFDALNDPEIFARFAKEIQEQISAREVAGKGAKYAANALNLPRALMSSMDLSAPLRQGIFLIGRKEYWKAFAQMFRYAGSQEAYNDLMLAITKKPTYPKMVESGLALSTMGDRLSSREEAFMSKWAEKVPGVKRSERAYTGFLNKLRADVFDNIVTKAEQASGEELDKKALKDIASFVNNASGRGDLGKLNSSVPLLTGLFFSPRLMAARVNMLNPVYYARLSPVARKEAIKSLLSFGAVATTVLGLAAAAGASVETDPRSSDYAKIKLGNTRYDVLGGFAQYLTLGSRLVTNQYKTSTGDIADYGNKYGQTNRLDAFLKFLENKEAPVPSFITDYLRGVDATGEKFEPGSAVAQRFIPMFMQDVHDVMKEEGAATGAVMSIPALFGVGMQSYTPKGLDPDAKIEAPDSFEMSELDDGENDLVEVKDGVVTLKDQAKTEWTDRLNFYIKEWMKDEMAKPEWKSMSDKDKAKVLSEVRSDARKQTKEDMIPLMGLSDEDTEEVQ